MKNVFLFLAWVTTLVLAIFDLKLEETPFVFYASFVSVMISTVFFFRNVYYYLHEESKWQMSHISLVIDISILIVIIGVFILIFNFLPNKHVFNFAVFMWTMLISSSKLTIRGGIIGRILDTPRLFDSVRVNDSGKTQYRLRYEVRSIFYALSPFHNPHH